MFICQSVDGHFKKISLMLLDGEIDSSVPFIVVKQPISANELSLSLVRGESS
jgi:hypothetical protein